MPRLVLLSEGLTGRTYELKTDKTTVGRVSDNAFEIPEASVSSHHCEIFQRGGDIVVKDLGSTNGTFINGEKIDEAVLKPGQILRVGMIEMRLETGDAAAASSTTASKKQLEQTRIIPQGVKLDELEHARPLDFTSKAGFERKSNRGTRIFIVAAIVIGVVLVLGLIFVLVRGSAGQ
jgi:pSer/pThr/pTyr-binding forkhead associated (FHA) protein